MKTIQKLIMGLLNSGYRNAVLCAGARNALLVRAIAEAQGFTLWSQPDERSASFFCLGISQNLTNRAFVVTTSGTAVSECFSAVIEAHYQGSRLLIVTADRPRRYHHSGAPQAINQIRIFGEYARYFELSDLEDDGSLTEIEQALVTTEGPIHINVFLEDPKIVITQVNWDRYRESILNRTPSLGSERPPIQVSTQHPIVVNSQKKPLILIGPLYRTEEQQKVQDWLSGVDQQVLIYSESTSNLNSGVGLSNLEKWLVEDLHQGHIDTIIKIGGTPTTKIWRDIEEYKKAIRIYNFSNAPYPGLSRKDVSSFRLDQLELLSIEASSYSLQMIARDHQLELAKQSLLSQYPESEVGWFLRLKNHFRSARVYLGNSLPIRYWDFVGGQAVQQVWASRGANGIDGQLSTFLGWVVSHPASDSQFVGIFGDLTALYDLQALWVYHQFRARFENLSVSIVIINNRGGQIFNKILSDPIFINHHNLGFESWARMFEAPYQVLQTKSDTMQEHRGLKIFEVLPSSDQQAMFESKWTQL